MVEEARWFTYLDLDALHTLGRPPWPRGVQGLGGTELLEWAKYLSEGGRAAPLGVLALKGAAVKPFPAFSWSGSTLVDDDDDDDNDNDNNNNNFYINNNNNNNNNNGSKSSDNQRNNNSYNNDNNSNKNIIIRNSSGMLQLGALSPVRIARPAHAAAYHAPPDKVLPPGLRTIMATTRIRGLHLVRDRAKHRSWGLDVGEWAVPENELGFSSLAVVTTILGDGAAHTDNRVRVGDCLLAINGEWLLSFAHARDVLAACKDDDEIDLAVSRNEALPAAPDGLDSLSDQELEALAFQQLGLRLTARAEGWSRDALLQVVAGRFSDSPAAPRLSFVDKGGKAAQPY